MEEPPADEEPPLDGDEEELGDEGEEEAADDENEDANADPSGGAAGGGKRRLRRRLRADELNLLKAPMDVIVELTEATLEELAAHATAAPEPQLRSGKQESLESIFNTFAYRS